MAVSLRSGSPYPAPDDEIYRLLVESINDFALFVVDVHGRIVTWNSGAENITGYTQEEIVGRNFSILYDEADVTNEAPETDLKQAKETGHYASEGWRIRKDGSRIWTQAETNALYDANSRLRGFCQLIIDVTNTRAESDRLQLFKHMVSAVRDYAIFVLDKDGNVLTWNEGAERINGYKADEIIGNHFSVFYPEADLAWNKPQKELEIATQEGRYEEEGWRLRRDGTRFWASVVITALRDDSGELRGFAKVTRDLTERKLAEERLESYARRLELARDQAVQASILKSQFVANVSHEIRTPMSGLLGMAELLQFEDLNENAREMVKHIYDSARNLLEILNDLLDFSKIEAGKLVIEARPFSIREIIDNVIDSVALAAEQKGLELKALIADDVPAEAVGDALRIRQVLMNLVTNAIKFTGKGFVHITVTKDKEMPETAIVRFAVQDTGIGIAQDKQKMLFEPFVQADGSMTRRYGGTGLGLSISKRLVDMMLGSIGLHSKEGEGSTFWFTVPLSKRPTD